MTKFNCAVYSMIDGLQGIFKNIMMSFMSLSMLIGSLLVVGSLAMIVVNIDSIIGSIGDKNEIVVYVDESYSTDQINSISNEIMSMEHVSEMVFVSRETALEEMKQELKEYASVLEGMDEDNPLRDGFNVKVDDPDYAAEVADKLSNIDGIEKVRARIDIINSFISIRNTVNIVCIGLMILLGAVSLLILTNTIKMSAYTRREEIGIMRMVGATKGMIRLSFLTEGTVICLIGSITAYFLLELAYKGLFVKALSGTGFITAVNFSDYNIIVLLFFIGTGALMGIAGSSFSIRKYLNV